GVRADSAVGWGRGLAGRAADDEALVDPRPLADELQARLFALEPRERVGRAAAQPREVGAFARGQLGEEPGPAELRARGGVGDLDAAGEEVGQTAVVRH